MIIKLLNRQVKIKFSRSANREMKSLKSTICLEMELLYSCLIKKKIHKIILDNNPISANLGTNIILTFRPITTNFCAPKNIDIYSHEDIEIRTLDKPERFIPDWVSINFSNNEWCGEFGYDRKLRKQLK